MVDETTKAQWEKKARIAENNLSIALFTGSQLATAYMAMLSSMSKEREKVISILSKWKADPNTVDEIRKLIDEIETALG